jgi:hypothetical protein
MFNPMGMYGFPSENSRYRASRGLTLIYGSDCATAFPAMKSDRAKQQKVNLFIIRKITCV